MPTNLQLHRLARDLKVDVAHTELFELALTHRSVSSSKNNERLEFLGDAVLGQVIARALFERFPTANEGQLSRMRASLVNGKVLATIAKELDFSDYLVLGVGELKSGGHRRESILADALEAIIGAVYLSAGIDLAEEMILFLYQERLQSLSPEQIQKDAKSQLQELLQSRSLNIPVYSLVESRGADHNRVFVVKCELEELEQVFMGENTSRKKAEQDAARAALQYLEEL